MADAPDERHQSYEQPVGWNLVAGIDFEDASLENLDLRAVGAPSLFHLCRPSSIYALVLQVEEVRDVSRPLTGPERTPDDAVKTARSEATTALLVCRLTDGTSSVMALVLGSVPGLSADTVPGTKVAVRDRRLLGAGPSDLARGASVVLAGRRDLEVLGGRVPSIAKAWEQQRAAAARARHDHLTGGRQPRAQRGAAASAPVYVPYDPHAPAAEGDAASAAGCSVETLLAAAEDVAISAEQTKEWKKKKKKKEEKKEKKEKHGEKTVLREGVALVSEGCGARCPFTALLSQVLPNRRFQMAGSWHDRSPSFWCWKWGRPKAAAQ